MLIKHVLSSIPLHVFAIFDPPKSVITTLEHIFSRFLWGSHDGTSKRVWRAWGQICRPINENGLSVHSLSDITLSFSCKLW